WVGYFDRGLDIVDLPSRRAVHVEDARVFCVNRIVHDPGRDLSAVATANGLVIMDGSGHERQILTKQDGLIADHVNDVALLPGPASGDGLQAMVVATPAGLTFLDSSGARSLYAFHGLVNNHVYSIGLKEDISHHRLMAGTLGGITLFEAGVIRANFTNGN